MKPYFHLFASVLFVLLLAEILPVNAQDKFSFFAIGDMPYHNPHDLERFPEIVQAINAEMVGSNNNLRADGIGRDEFHGEFVIPAK